MAENNSFITIVNPVRGDELFAVKPPDALWGVKYQKSLIDQQNLPATWLLRYDILSSEPVVYFKAFLEDSNKQQLGLFLEITPSLAKTVNLDYPQGGLFWHDANKIFLSGYKPEDRIKLMDEAFKKFKENFGFYPKSVGAWHIDAFSAKYMKDQYGITGVLICADQFGTDNYQIWGGWWGAPFYPSKYNILTPAQTIKNKLDLVVFWWAARDPKLGYGGSVNESTYSVQVNDYQSHDLGVDYFKKLLNTYLNDKRNQFGQVTIGLENDNNWQNIGNGFEEQLKEIGRRTEKGEIEVKTMEEFSKWYVDRFTKLSPTHFIDNWEMNLNYRIGVEDGKIIDLRIYNELWPEANLLTANPWETLSLNNPYKIDTVRFTDTVVKTDFKINAQNLIKRFKSLKLPFKFSNIHLGLYFLIILLLLISFLRKNLPLLFLIILGSISLSWPMIKSGLVYPFGMGFWGPNGHDGIWHISLINQITKFSLDMPVFSGMKLGNYHFGFDLMAAILRLITKIPVANIYFQILPPAMAVLIGVMTFKFAEKLTLSKAKAWWSAFFVYFGGSWGWIVSLLRTGQLGGESTFWANQSVSTLINPPFALSLIILLAGLLKFLDYIKDSSKKNLLLCSLLFGILVQVKIYIGVAVLGSLFCLLLIVLMFYRHKIKMILHLFLGTLLVSLILFLPFNHDASSFLVLSPLWFPHAMLAYGDRLGWFKLENARIAYFNSGNWIKWLLAEIVALTIFISGNLGTRILGLFYGGLLGKRKIKLSETEIFLLGILLISLVMPLLFIQKGNPWNTIQFFYYFQFISALFTGLVVGDWWKKKKTAIVAMILIILTLPTTITTLRNDYLPSRPPARVSIEELEALAFLQKQSQGNVLTFPHNSDWKSKFSEPKPLYAYETTAYVSALSAQKCFLEDEMNLEITGFLWQERKDEARRFFLTNDHSWANAFLSGNKIKYIYLVRGQKMNLGLGDISGEKIFENGETVIYEVK